MTTAPDSGFSAAGVAAVVAGLAGIVLLAFGGVRLAGLVGESVVDGSAVSSVTATTAATTVEPGSPTTRPPPTFDPGSFVTVSDDTGSVSAAVPRDWVDVSGSGWTVDDRRVGLAVTAAPSVDAWYSSWDTPGAFIGVSTTDFAPGFDDFSRICTAGKSDDRSAGVLSGAVQAWSQCGGESNDFYVFVGGPVDDSYTVLIQLISRDGTGVGTLEHLLATFSYQP